MAGKRSGRAPAKLRVRVTDPAINVPQRDSVVIPEQRERTISVQVSPAVMTARVFLIALWCVCLYRAATQSFVHDEAFTWELYLQQPLSYIFNFFSANHHFLNTILMRLSMAVFGMSELSLRLPTLAAAALFFWAIYKLAHAVFGSGFTMLVAVAAVTLNPLTLDFMVAARGYGLALALWTLSLATMTEILMSSRLQTAPLAMAGTTLALSVTANLCFVLPAASLASAFLVLVLRRSQELLAAGRKKKNAPALKRSPIWLSFVGSIAGIAIVFVAAYPFDPFNPAHRADFYAGAATLVESARNLAGASLQHTGPLRGLKLANLFCDIAAFGIAPLVLLAGLWIGFGRRDPLLMLTSTCAAATVLLLILLHLAIGLLYPVDRTGIYFGPILTIVLIRLAYLTRGFWYISGSAYTLAGILVVLFLTEFDVHRFMVWEYDADTNLLAQEIARRHDPATTSVRVGGDWMLAPALEFYRVKNHWTWMAPVTRQAVEAPADFYALIPSPRDLRQLNLVPVWVGPIAHSILALRPSLR